MYEVELKFRLVGTDSVVARLAELGAQPLAVVEQSDAYFSHPSRDFAQTDEALRIRTTGSHAGMTYKGPVVDRRTKTRREIEVSLAELGEAVKLTEALVALGFEPVRTVQKMRRPYRLERGDRWFEAALDEVVGLGGFIEIETLAEEGDKEGAVEAILALAAELGLSNPERKSYLCLLLEKNEKKR